MEIQIQTIVSAPFAENSYLLWRRGSREAIVIDPGFEPDAIFDALAENELQLVAILNTHGHIDHIAGNAEMKLRYPDAPILIGTGDAIMLTDAVANLSEPFGMPVTSPPADRLLNEGDQIQFAGMEFKILDVPGHSPGHIVYVMKDAPWLLGGDVLFRGGIGRTDFPNGNMKQLLTGIRTKLWPLPGATIVYPGHGPVTTIGHEKRTNPFCGDNT